MLKFFTPSFWFTLRPAPLFQGYEIVLISLFGLFIIVSIVFSFIKKDKKIDSYLRKRFDRFQRMFLALGAAGFALLFFTYEKAYVFGARFWYLIWILGFLTWLGFIIYDLIKKMPKERKADKDKASFEKYLPKKK
jgi:amino acid transporter